MIKGLIHMGSSLNVGRVWVDDGSILVNKF